MKEKLPRVSYSRETSTCLVRPKCPINVVRFKAMREPIDEKQCVFPSSTSISSNEEFTKGEPLTTKTEAGTIMDFRDRRPQKASLFISLSVVSGSNVSHESRVIPLKHSFPTTSKVAVVRSEVRDFIPFNEILCNAARAFWLSIFDQRWRFSIFSGAVHRLLSIPRIWDHGWQ
jgi:hypothetical protein